MPRLPEDVVATTQNAEDSKEFKAIPPGRYVVRLKEVRTEDSSGEQLVGKDSGVPYWNWVFQIAKQFHPEVGARVFFRTLSLGESSAPMRKEAFAAFGYTAQSDTDEIVEDPDAYAVAVIKQKPKYNGEKGEKDNEIVRLVPFDPTKWKVASDDPDADDWDTDQ